MTGKRIILAYAAGAYIMAMVNIAYIIGFFADFGVPKSISDGEPTALWVAVSIDMGLICLFGLHHSFTARISFKRWWTKIIPAPIERATYLYMTLIATALLVFFWKPIPVTIWQIESPWAVVVIYAAFLAACTMMLAATFHFGHFSFFGLAQAWENFRASSPKPSNMSSRYLYALVRHPISLGWMILPFLTPHFTVGHFVFAAGTFAYIILATPFEEADLIEDLGCGYNSYRNRVPAFLPLVRKRPERAATSPGE